MKNVKKQFSRIEYSPDDSYCLEYSSDTDSLRDWAIISPGRLRTWIVCLHGHGSHGDQLFTCEDIRKAWLCEFISTGAGIICPNLRDNAWMSPAAVSDLHDILDFLRREHGAGKFVFYAGSMGGTGNLIYATRHPEDVAACVALGAATDLASFYEWCMNQPEEFIANQLGRAIEESYGGKPTVRPQLFAEHSTLKNCENLNMPIFFAHGEKDQLIPIGQARMLAARMATYKNFVYHEVAGGDHGSPLFLPEAMEFLKYHISNPNRLGG
ncbi:MAG TPA: alpha/beta hydrolase [Phycisphaerae bacterium]|nr:alpha/beta hydrolase [Phycisphaerae bacterium]